ncbi:MAG: elongation factor P maturation arginine rhamnosyltransferase EarP [Burkholderiaceae bacterium]|nr:elongation factor P maturation arginine rhamnosyltransferase EarP [Burkholderiaceae bacterium]
MPAMPPAHWDLFCRVVDNLGDAGVCWRLAAALGRRGVAVRLWIDDPGPLAWMAPEGAAGVTVRPWSDPPPDGEPGAVVIEAFGCDPPPGFVERMARRTPPPLWINLEYLSAEPYVERSHRLPSPQFSGPGAGLTKWFFYPGFTPATGGLLHDDAAVDEAAARAWLQQQGWGPAAGERIVVVFCYRNPALPGVLALLALRADRPTRLLVPPGPAQAQLAGLPLPAGLRWTALPHLPQADFDRLLAAADFNLVRGEDSFVRAQVGAAGAFLWQAYPQADGAHAAKLEAFLDRYLAGAAPGVAAVVRQAFRGFNALAPLPATWPAPAAWQAVHRAWRERLLAQDDLCTQLLRFVGSR